MKTKQDLYYPNVFRINLMNMGINSKKIVEATGLKSYTVSRIFADKPIITLENAVKISKCLNIPLDSLFDETDIPKYAAEGKG